MRGAECLGSFMFYVVPWNYGSSKTLGVFAHTSQLVHPSPHKNEIYRHIKFGVSDIYSMVIVPFTISAWFLWCTDFSIPKVDGHPQTGKTYAKIIGWVFQHPFSKHRYPPKKTKTTTINTQVNTWILCHYFHVGEQGVMGWKQSGGRSIQIIYLSKSSSTTL